MTLSTALAAAGRHPAIRRGGSIAHHPRRLLLSSLSTTTLSSSSPLLTSSNVNDTNETYATSNNLIWHHHANSRTWYHSQQLTRNHVCIRLFSTTASNNDSDSNNDENKTDVNDDEKKNEGTGAPPVEDAEDVDVSVGEKESLEFQAETKQLLDIVTNSLYSEKEVFLRELVSNASDSLEKLRQLQLTTDSSNISDSDVPLEIRIDVDEVTSTITISDTGIGMTKNDMISNLGTIAKSGSRAFVQELERQSEEGKKNASLAETPDLDLARGIIGKFGVGFYSVFMVARKVEVRSKPALMNADNDDNSDSYVWTSDGTGTFDIAKLSPDVRQDRGTSIVIHLHSDFWHLCNEDKLTELLKTYR